MSQSYEDIEWSQNPDGEKLDILQEQAGLIQDVASLISELPATQEPVSEAHAYSFTVLPFSTPYAFPRALQPVVSDIDDFLIELGDAQPSKPGKLNTPAYLSVEFSAGSDSYYISRSGETENSDLELTKIPAKHTHPSVSTPVQVGTVSRAELNALLMSIVLPNSDNDYEAFKDKELQSAEAYESLCQLLSSKALGQIDTYYFLMNDEEVDLKFTKENGQASSFTISYYDIKRKLPLVVEYDIGAESSLRFFSVEGPDKTPFIATVEEVSYLRKLLRLEPQIELQRFTVERGEVIEPVSLGPDDTRTLSNEASALVDRVLDQLGLNPPNTSA